VQVPVPVYTHVSSISTSTSTLVSSTSTCTSTLKRYLSTAQVPVQVPSTTTPVFNKFNTSMRALRLAVTLEFFLLFSYARILYVYSGLSCSNKICLYICMYVCMYVSSCSSESRLKDSCLHTEIRCFGHMRTLRCADTSSHATGHNRRSGADALPSSSASHARGRSSSSSSRRRSK